MLLALSIGFIGTLTLGVLIILPLWWRNRRMPNFTPDESLIALAMERQFGQNNWRYEPYTRRV